MSSISHTLTVFTVTNIQISLNPHNSERNLKVAANHRLLKSYICGYNVKKTL